MTRGEVLLAILAASEGRPYTPAQIQKAAFLVTRNIPRVVDAGPGFDFAPYDYGPFDQGVYSEAENLRAEGYAEITQAPGAKWNRYAASDDGVAVGHEALRRMAARDRNYILEVSRWVRSQTFEQLIKSIYAQYPEMRVNSIFRG